MRVFILLLISAYLFSFNECLCDDIFISKRLLRLNNDTIQDTLRIAKSTGKNSYLHKIALGNKSNRINIIYPNWQKFNSSLNIEDFNKDTLADLHITMWGKYTDSNSVTKDTVVSIVIFGQSALDTLQQINLADSLYANQQRFAFVKLSRNVNLLQELVRDYTYTYSYIVPDLSIPNPPQPKILSVSEDKNDNYLDVFPNPTSNSINIKLKSSLSGEATLKIIDLKGQEYYQSKISLDEISSSVKNLTLSQFVSGTYILTLETESQDFFLFKHFTIIK